MRRDDSSAEGRAPRSSGRSDLSVGHKKCCPICIRQRNALRRRRRAGPHFMVVKFGCMARRRGARPASRTGLLLEMASSTIPGIPAAVQCYVVNCVFFSSSSARDSDPGTYCVNSRELIIISRQLQRREPCPLRGAWLKCSSGAAGENWSRWNVTWLIPLHRCRNG